MNTGHEGSMGTLHANSAEDAMQRLQTMITMAGARLEQDALAAIVGRSLHVVVQAMRLPDGQRKITSISEIVGVDGHKVQTADIFVYNRTGVDEEGRIQGAHAYVAESQLLERFYQFGALKRPRA
jgi:pilus assembly protein CpaF